MITLTRKLARAIGWDAGNHSMKKAGRKQWNVDDWNTATEITNKLLEYCDD